MLPAKHETSEEAVLRVVYGALADYFGPRHWWPTFTGSPWEIMLGAILTQRTSWRNVNTSLRNMLAALGADGLAEPTVVLELSEEELAALIRPAGHYRSKPRRLKVLAEWVLSKGGLGTLIGSDEPTEYLREQLLLLWGIGPETADAILLYALDRPAFVADAYTLRLASRWGLLPAAAPYGEIQALFTRNLPVDVPLYSEYHALIIEHGKNICRPRPLCERCPLNRLLPLSVQDSRDNKDSSAGRQEWICPKKYVDPKQVSGRVTR